MIFRLEILFIVTGAEVTHAKGYGRIAFSVPHRELLSLNQTIKDANQKILTDLVSLDTPGKASVTVVILADPVGFDCNKVYHTILAFSHFTDKKKNNFINRVMY